MSRGSSPPKAHTRPVCDDLAPFAAQWLGRELEEALSELWCECLWIPQEALGFSYLRFL